MLTLTNFDTLIRERRLLDYVLTSIDTQNGSVEIHKDSKSTIHPRSDEDWYYIDNVIRQLPNVRVVGHKGVSFEYPQLSVIISDYIISQLNSSVDEKTVYEQANRCITSPELWCFMMLCTKKIWMDKWTGMPHEEKVAFFYRIKELINIQRVTKFTWTDTVSPENANLAFSWIKKLDKKIIPEFSVVYASLLYDKGNAVELYDLFELCVTEYQYEDSEEYEDTFYISDIYSYLLAEYVEPSKIDYVELDTFSLYSEEQKNIDILKNTMGLHFGFDSWLTYHYHAQNLNIQEETLML